VPGCSGGSLKRYWAIDTLQDIERGIELDIERQVRAKAGFAVGDWVEFIEGLLKGQRMKVAALDGRKRLRLIIGGHGTERPFVVSRSAVEKVAGQDPGESTDLLTRNRAALRPISNYV
jgi:transcription antitermination factor NusG